MISFMYHLVTELYQVSSLSLSLFSLPFAGKWPSFIALIPARTRKKTEGDDSGFSGQRQKKVDIDCSNLSS